MAWLRARKLKTGTFFYVVTKDGHYIPAGKQRTVATEILAEADRVERLRDQLQNGVLYFPPHKGGAERRFAIPPRVARFLEESAGARWIFPGRGGDPREGIRRFWQALCVKAKLSGVTPHALRHSAASIEFAAGKQIPDIQQLLGHGSPQMAVRLYAHVFPKVMKPIGAFRLGARQTKRKGKKRRKTGERAISQDQRVRRTARSGSNS